MSNADWIVLGGNRNGSGDGRLDFTVMSYEGSADRSSTLVVAAQTLTIGQQACRMEFAQREEAFADAASTADVELKGQAGCEWSVEGVPAWMTVSPASGAGPAHLRIQVTPNDGTVAREAALNLGGSSMTVRQSAGAGPSRCDYALDVQPLQVADTGGSGTIAVRTGPTCAWQLTTNASWIHLTSSSGVGRGGAQFDVAANSQQADRTATFTANGARVSLVQRAPTCTFAVTPVQLYVRSSGGAAAVTVTTKAGCAWTASTAVPWIHLNNNGAQGTNNIPFLVDPNPEGYGTDFRKAAIEIRWKSSTQGENAWVSQYANCNTVLSPAPGTSLSEPNTLTFGADGGAAHLFVLTESPFRCPWVVENQPSPFTVTAPPIQAIQNGDGDLHITAPPNPSSQTRTVTVVVGERTLTIVQAGR